MYTQLTIFLACYGCCCVAEAGISPDEAMDVLKHAQSRVLQDWNTTGMYFAYTSIKHTRVQKPLAGCRAALSLRVSFWGATCSTYYPSFLAAYCTVGGVKSAVELFEKQSSCRKIITFCSDLDKILGGGVWPGQVTELCKCTGRRCTGASRRLRPHARVVPALPDAMCMLSHERSCH